MTGQTVPGTAGTLAVTHCCFTCYALIANLILARSVRREGELAVRVALGASSGALRRTLLAESLLLCGIGAMLGVSSRCGWWTSSADTRPASLFAPST
jgi:predicted lysophospholipase L1 biosynthesis ABC-type transport system permease subunit